jgi:hypothetical protein
MSECGNPVPGETDELEEYHREQMLDPEYRAAYEAAERRLAADELTALTEELGLYGEAPPGTLDS